jgi:hypothetical protein
MRSTDGTKSNFSADVGAIDGTRFHVETIGELGADRPCVFFVVDGDVHALSASDAEALAAALVKAVRS